MDAPLYPPAAAYEKPVVAPYEFGVETLTLKELLSAPATEKILYAELPGMKMVVQSGLKVHLSTFTLRDVMTFGGVRPENLAKIDAQLRALPIDQRPAL
jgi:hypothetical protein